MVRVQKFFWLIILGLGLTMVCLKAQNEKSNSGPQNVLSAMIEAELGGDSNTTRRDYIVFSAKRSREEKKKDSEFGGTVVQLDWSPYIIVKSNQLGSVTVTKDNATGIVIFDRVARHGRDAITVDTKANDTVLYRLIKRKDKWFVIDPPMPHVSFQAALSFFRGQVRFDEGLEWVKHATEDEKKFVNIDKRKLAFLESLK